MSTVKLTKQERFFANPTIDPSTGETVKIGSPKFNKLCDKYERPTRKNPLNGNSYKVGLGGYKNLMKVHGFTEDELLNGKHVPHVKVGDQFYPLERVQEWKAYWEKDHKKILKSEEKAKEAKRKEAEKKLEEKKKEAEEKKNKKTPTKVEESDTTTEEEVPKKKSEKKSEKKKVVEESGSDDEEVPKKSEKKSKKKVVEESVSEEEVPKKKSEKKKVVEEEVPKKKEEKKKVVEESVSEEEVPKKKSEKKKVVEEEVPKKKEENDETIKIVKNYTDKSFILVGNTKSHIPELKKMFGSWNTNLKGDYPKGWVFSNKQLGKVTDFVEQVQPTEKPEKKEEVPKKSEKKTEKVSEEGIATKFVENITKDCYSEFILSDTTPKDIVDILPANVKKVLNNKANNKKEYTIDFRVTHSKTKVTYEIVFYEVAEDAQEVTITDTKEGFIEFLVKLFKEKPKATLQDLDERVISYTELCEGTEYVKEIFPKW